MTSPAVVYLDPLHRIVARPAQHPTTSPETGEIEETA